MNLNSNQVAVQDGRSSQNVERFRAFCGGLNAPRRNSALRRHDRPHANVLARIPVGVFRVSALLATEAQAITVGRRDMAAGAAPAAGVSRINLLHFNADVLRFVGNVELPLSERPSVDFGAEVFPSFERTVSNVRQVFNDNPPCAVRNRILDQCFGSDMQEMSCYSSLVSIHPPQEAAGRAGANRLDLCAGSTDASTAVIKFAAIEEKCFGVGRIGGDHQPLDAEINTNNAASRLRLRRVNMMGQQKIPHAVNSLEFRLSPTGDRNGLGGQCDYLAKDADAMLARAHKISPRHHRQSRLLVNTKPPPIHRLGCFVGSCDLSEYVACQLRWCFKLLSDRGVESALQPVGVQFFGLEHLFGHPVCRLQITNGNGVEHPVLSDLNLDCSHNFQYINYMAQPLKAQVKSKAILKDGSGLL